MRSSQCIERDNSGTVCCAQLLHLEGKLWIGSSAMYPKMPFYEGGKLACESE